ncbi:triple tyrosine motif-containing protein [Aquimarina litoralis]|uniref:triple tyrosine motif-containing protein n=1 Tax=Aquimarina litoralis TaxID=584605 RepID=UPI001C58B3F5|nr:triple tyrosine motif-containing protein [Aquimarina litoralis]MBW1294427.1 hypothetical protein [Aquimarina litoralis]
MFCYKTYFTLFFISFFLPWQGTTQNEWKKITQIRNYSSKNIGNAAPKTYDITQTKQGTLYFANEYGLLEYDGTSWDILLQPNNRSHISSILADDSRIYIGGNNEIGFVEKNSFDQAYYRSLNQLLAKNCTNFSLVWGIFKIRDEVYFCTNTLFIKFNTLNNSIQCIPNPYGAKNGYKINNMLYFIDNENNIRKLIDYEIEHVFSQNVYASYAIKHMLPYDADTVLVFTQKKGGFLIRNNTLFPWGANEKYGLENLNISKAILLNNGIYCIGTTNNGILFLNRSGEILQKLDRDNKLLGNNVIDLFLDKTNNLWATLDGSISYLELNSPFYTLSEDDGIYGTTYDIKNHKDTLYVATSNGVYYSPWPLPQITDRFKKKSEIQGQIWDLSIVDEQLLVGGHDGSYSIKNGKVTTISNIPGGWNFVEIPNQKNLLLQGTYSGLVVYEKIEGNWILKHKIKGFDDVAREVTIDDNYTVWISHGYKGIYKLKLNTTYEEALEINFYDQQKGFPSNLFINLLDEVSTEKQLFGTQSGIYEYNKQLDSMMINDKYESILTDQQLIRRLKKISDTKILFIQGYDRDDDIGIIDFDPTGNYTIIREPFQRLKNQLIPAFEKIIKFKNGDLGFTSKNGVIIYNKDVKLNYDSKFKTLLKNVKIKDSIVYGNVKNYITDIQKDSVLKPIPFRLNKLNFSYAAPFYEHPSSLQYQTYLEGLEEDWSSWSPETQKEYNFLPYGSYIFKVRAKNIYGKIGDEAQYKFVIKPPWYKSSPMWVVYILFVLLVLYSILRIKNEQRKKGIQKLKIAHQKEMELQQVKFEEKRLKEKNDKIKRDNKLLKQNLEGQNKELASSAMQIVQIDNHLLQLKKTIDQVYATSEGENRKQLRKIIKSLDDQIKGDNNWKNFETHFNQIHDNSLQRLRETYPDLNHREIRLCAYLKLNLSSKEIAPLMGISYRGIESLRFRIRKKMELDTTTNLTDYIIKF